MLLQSLEHLGYRVAGLAAVVYGLDKTDILDKIVNDGDNDVVTAVKTSALLSGSEYLSDHLLSILTNVKVPSLYTSIQQFGMAFVVNAVVLYAVDKLNLEEVIVRGGSDEMKAIQFGILFVIIQEISYKLISMYMGSGRRLAY